MLTIPSWVPTRTKLGSMGLLENAGCMHRMIPNAAFPNVLTSTCLPGTSTEQREKQDVFRKKARIDNLVGEEAWRKRAEISMGCGPESGSTSGIAKLRVEIHSAWMSFGGELAALWNGESKPEKMMISPLLLAPTM